ncbi:MAG: DNA repair protein RecO [Eubacteriales bacterium]|jgi:DNA repair protein RecO (recombination protein O)
MLENLTGLVIQEVDYADSDRIITILTEKGRISARVPGGRKIKSKKLAGTNLFCYSHFSVHERQGRRMVTQVELVESFFRLRERVETASLAYYIAQLCYSVTEENLESNSVLRLTLNTLYMLTRPGADCEKIKAVYELRLLSLTGHMPDLVGCRECGAYQGEMWFLPEEGRLVCEDCAAPEDREQGVRLNGTVLTALRYILYSEDGEIFRFHISPENQRYLGVVTERYALYRLDRHFSTLEFYKSVSQTEN